MRQIGFRFSVALRQVSLRNVSEFARLVLRFPQDETCNLFGIAFGRVSEGFAQILSASRQDLDHKNEYFLSYLVAEDLGTHDCRGQLFQRVLGLLLHVEAEQPVHILVVLLEQVSLEDGQTVAFDFRELVEIELVD